MHFYTTLFNSFYLSRGILMYESLESCSSDYHLFIFAFDDLTFDILTGLKPENVTVIPLREFETDELMKVKKERTIAEYCWTCTPSVISYVIEKYNVPECTYLDADLFFYSDPSILISELDSNKKNVLITEHRYSILARLYEEKRAGRFCVQFVTFKNEESSLKVLDRWRLQCIEWCYARHENGKFGDQKYLDEWPQLYENIHILDNPGGGIAPWNILNYSFRDPAVKEKKTGRMVDPVFYHFQYVKCLGEGIYDAGWYPIPGVVRKLFYLPYISSVERTENKLQKLNKRYRRNYTELKSYISGNLVKRILKKYLRFNIQKIKWHI